MQLMVSDMQHVSTGADILQNADSDAALIVVVVQPPQPPDIKVIDALAYLDLVKDCFRENPAVYQSFLDTMGRFKTNRSVCFLALLQKALLTYKCVRITALEVCNRIASLFGSHPHLIVGFNTFLPGIYRLQAHRDGTASVSTSI
jgi:histone deacetylase complex regulatory component SIN3